MIIPAKFKFAPIIIIKTIKQVKPSSKIEINDVFSCNFTYLPNLGYLFKISCLFIKYKHNKLYNILKKQDIAIKAKINIQKAYFTKGSGSPELEISFKNVSYVKGIKKLYLKLYI